MSEDLLARWLDDRASLTEEEAVELGRLLGADPALAQQAKSQLVTDELLSRHLGVDRGNFENQVVQRLVGPESERTFVTSTLEAVRVERGRRWSWRARLPEAAAAAVLVAALFLLLRREAPLGEGMPASPASGSPGLRARYYRGRDLSGPSVDRVDPKIDFHWVAGQPPIAASKDVYSVRWTGKLTAKTTDHYLLRARYDDGVRLWVGGKLLLNDWNGRYVVVDRTVEVDLVAGQPVDLKIEYFNGGDRGVMQLSWSSPQQPEEVLPESVLSHD